MFEKATRLKIRWEYKGQLSVEDLWDLSVEALDKIYGSLSQQKKDTNEYSLLKTVSKEDEILELKTQIVRHIVATKLDEKDRRRAAATAKMQRDKIEEIIRRKEDAELENMGIEDLKKMMTSL